MFIDTHAHLFLKDNPFDNFDAKQVFSDSLKAGVEQIWLVGTNKYDNLKNIDFAKKHSENAKCWVGFHPENYKEFDLAWLNQILKSEILNSKSETNSKLQIRNLKDRSFASLRMTGGVGSNGVLSTEMRDSSGSTLSNPLNDHVINLQSKFKRGTAPVINLQSKFKRGTAPVINLQNKFKRGTAHVITKSDLIKRGTAKGDERFYQSQAPSRMTRKVVVGVGEVGIDLNWNDKSTTKAQQQVFEDQIKLANKYNLPVSIHSRDAFAETVEVMQRFKDTKFVWHCFNLDKKQTGACLSTFPNLYLGLNAIVTYKSGEYIWDSLKQVPSSKIIIETDCPFLKPRSSFKKSENLSTKSETNLKDRSFASLRMTEGVGRMTEGVGRMTEGDDYQDPRFYQSSSLARVPSRMTGEADDQLFDLSKYKYNTPYGVVPVYNFVAEKLGMSVAELILQVEKNCDSLAF